MAQRQEGRNGYRKRSTLDSMARGFDSKSVSDQQEAQEREHDRPERAVLPSARHKSLELARADLLRRLESAPESHRASLRAALAAVEDLLRQA
jgi:hypothetical protein